MTASAQSTEEAEHGHDHTGLTGTGSATFWFSGFFLHQHLSGLSGKNIQGQPGMILLLHSCGSSTKQSSSKFQHFKFYKNVSSVLK